MPATTWSTVRAGEALPAKERLDLDGAALAYLSAGQPAAPAVLLVHGFPRNGYLWRGCLRPLETAGYRAIAPDLPGLGDSEAPQSGDFSLAAQARALHLLLEHLRVGEVRLVAEGVGAPVALGLVALRPGGVRRVVLDARPDGSGARSVTLLAAGLVRAGLGEAVLATLSAARAFARLRLGSAGERGPSASAGDLYLRPLLSSPEARARTLAWLAALRPGEAVEVCRELERTSPRPSMLLRPGAVHRAETAPRELVAGMLPFLAGR